MWKMNRIELEIIEKFIYNYFNKQLIKVKQLNIIYC